MFVVLDTEVYPNYFLATFRFENGNVTEYEVLDDIQTVGAYSLNEIITSLMTYGYTLVTFNGNRYDLPILSYAMNDATNMQLKQLSDSIIRGNLMPWIAEKKYGFQTLDIDHIDIINILPGIASLKLYGARNSTVWLQDLPFDPDSLVNPRMATDLRLYCRNDCLVTYELFLQVWPEIELRMRIGNDYNQDLRSKSDAQIAEAVMKSEYKSRSGQTLIKPIDAGPLPTHVQYQPPAWIKFDDESLNRLVNDLSMQFFELDKAGSPLTPDWLKKKTMEIDGRRYAVGLGGLHAQNKSESYYSTPGIQIIDIDVRSYYPEVILGNSYEPEHMGHHFTDIYRALVNKRIAAKVAGDKITAEGLKITVNGTYGKLGSIYSAVYSPELMLAVTFTGQLALLMLIEKMAQNGIQCVSANTDGVTILTNDVLRYKGIVNAWEQQTGLTMEFTNYKSIHYRDVSNYFALTTEGKIKKIGMFRILARGKEHGLDKNPDYPIIAHAVIAYVLYGKNIDKTIGECTDIRQFLSVRTVKGGAAKDGEYLGKVVRWYCSTKSNSAIHYVNNGNQVAKSDNAMPMMNLVSDFPDDVDLEWYAYEANQMVDNVGYYGWL